MPATSLDQIVSLAKRRGFVFPGSAIYGGLANTWDYGPLGSQLKKNVKDCWWDTFVRQRTDMVGLDAAILMNPKVWEASGHVGSFADPMIECKNCHERSRSDKLIEEKIGDQFLTVITDFQRFIAQLRQLVDNMAKQGSDMGRPNWLKDFFANSDFTKKLDTEHQDYFVNYASNNANNLLSSKGLNMNQIYSILVSIYRIACPFCKAINWSESKQFNLMFKTYQGVIEGEGALVYLRPETAQGIFVNFKNVLDTTRMRLPFGIAQIGKAFRNEITPGNFTFRTREFEQMEIEYFFDPSQSDWHAVFDEWKKGSWSFITETLGIDPHNLRFRDHEQDELSHYSKGTTDIEYKFPWGWGELCAAAAYRTDFDLRQHAEFSKQELVYTDPDEPTRKVVPHVMEPSFGADRVTLAALIDAYTEETLANGETRIVLRLPASIAPFDVAILPLSKKEHLIAKARELYNKIVHETDLVCDFDVTGSIGKRYRRQDEIGTPTAVTVDFGTLGEDDAQGARDTVTIRDRDTLEQVRVPIDQLIASLKA